MTKATGAAIECKPCNKTFKNAAARGSHMRIVHGVIGVSPQAVKIQREKAGIVPLKLPKPTLVAKLDDSLGEFEPRQCPECELVCKGKAALSNHRRAAHGVVSPKHALLAKQKKRTPNSELEALETKPLEDKQIEKRVTESQATFNAIDPLLFAFTVGQIKEQCRHIAEEHDVPTKLFTRQFAELFYREARR